MVRVRRVRRVRALAGVAPLEDAEADVAVAEGHIGRLHDQPLKIGAASSSGQAA